MADSLAAQGSGLTTNFCLINSLDFLGKWVYDKAFLRASHTSRQLASQKASLACENYLKACGNIYNQLHKRSITIQPVYHLMAGIDYVYFILEKYKESIRHHYPDDLTFLELWKQFLFDFAVLRYQGENVQALEKTTQFVKDMSRLLMQVGGSEKDKEETLNLIQLFLENVDFLDLDFGLLLQKDLESRRISLTTSIEHLVHAFSILVKRLREEIPLVLDEIEKKLIPFTIEQEHSAFKARGHTQWMLQQVQKIRNRLPELNKYLTKDPRKITQFKKEIEIWVEDELQVLFQDSEGGNYNLGDGEANAFAMRLIYEDVCRQVTEKQLPPDYRFDLTSYQGHYVCENLKLGMNNQYGLYDGQRTLPEVKRLLDFFETGQQCHILGDTFILQPMTRLFRIISAITIWWRAAEALPAAKLRLQVGLINRLLTKQIVTPAPQVQQLQKAEEVDESWMNSVAVPSKKSSSQVNRKKQAQHKKSQKAKNKQDSKPANNQPNVNRTLSASSKRLTQASVVAAPAPVELSPLAKARQFADRLKALVVSHHAPNDQFLQVSARQALMFLEDLLVFLENPQLLSEPKCSAPLVFNLVYYQMEQWLRYQKLKSRACVDVNDPCDLHNLKALMYGIPSISDKNTEIARYFYLAYYWADYTYYQHESWRQWQCSQQPMPQALVDLYAVYEQPQSTHGKLNQNGLMSYIKQACDFSAQFPVDVPETNADGLVNNSADGKFFVIPPSLTRDLKVSISQYQEFLGKLGNYQDYSFFHLLKQTTIDLQILGKVFEQFKRQLSYREFSLWIRQAYYQQWTLTAKLLKSLYTLQTGIDTSEHDLSKLSEKITWEPALTLQEMNLLKKFKSVHNFARYPFENKYDHTAIYHAILQAELLREHPLEDGFTLNVTAGKTALNFVPMASSSITVSPNRLIKDLYNNWKELNAFICKRLLPTF